MFTLDRVVPWGRSFDEYRRMFALSDADLSGVILGCADGPASFNAVAASRGLRVISTDPVYQFSPDQIRRRIAETADDILAQTRRNLHEFVWDEIAGVEDLGRLRMMAMTTFLEDYQVRDGRTRYVAAVLPALPFATAAFTLAVCSHFLFLYSAHFDAAFHVAALEELGRVAGEVRVFPLLALGGERSVHLEPCCRTLAERGWQVSIERVPYEFQRGGNEMLRMKRPE